MEVDAFAISALAIAVVKAATVPFRILAIGAMPLSLPRGGVDAAAPTRAATGLQLAMAPGRAGDDAVGRPVRGAQSARDIELHGAQDALIDEPARGADSTEVI